VNNVIIEHEKESKMRAALLYGKEDLRVQDVATPEVNENEVLLQIKSAFVCGTDVRMFIFLLFA